MKFPIKLVLLLRRDARQPHFAGDDSAKTIMPVCLIHVISLIYLLFIKTSCLILTFWSTLTIRFPSHLN